MAIQIIETPIARTNAGVPIVLLSADDPGERNIIAITKTTNRLQRQSESTDICHRKTSGEKGGHAMLGVFMCASMALGEPGVPGDAGGDGGLGGVGSGMVLYSPALWAG